MKATLGFVGNVSEQTRQSTIDDLQQLLEKEIQKNVTGRISVSFCWIVGLKEIFG